ncbi:DUF2723 domain-containing protein [bacterium]|nr:DUF2723 domain-containing protein [bacterium]
MTHAPPDQERRPRPRGVAWAAPAALALVPLAVYLLTLAPTVMDGDSADFARQSYVLGLAHPPGYPMMGMLGRAITACLPFGSAATRANLVAPLAAVASLLLGYAILRRWSVPRVPALLAQGALALTPLFWSQALHINPYMPQVALVLAVMLLLEVWAAPSARDDGGGGRSRSVWLLALAAALYGFGIGGHPSFALYAPAVAIFGLLGLRGAGPRKGAWAIAAALGAAAVGCLPWIVYTMHYVSLGADGHAQGSVLSRTLAYVSAKGSPSDPMLFFTGVASRWYLSRAAQHVAATLGQWSPIGIGLALVGVVSLARRRWRSLLLVGLAYAAQSNFACTLRHWHFYDVYRLPTYALLALIIGAGLSALWQRLGSPALRWASCTALAALCVALGHLLLLTPTPPKKASGWLARIRPQPVLRATRARQNRADCAAALAAAEPKNAVLATWGATATLRFLQDVDGLAPDVWIIGDGPDGGALQWYLAQPTPPRERLYVLLRDDDRLLRQTLHDACDTRVVLRGALHEMHLVVSPRAAPESPVRGNHREP